MSFYRVFGFLFYSKFWFNFFFTNMIRPMMKFTKKNMFAYLLDPPQSYFKSLFGFYVKDKLRELFL